MITKDVREKAEQVLQRRNPVRAKAIKKANPTQTCRGLAFLYFIDVLGDAWYRQGR